MITLNKHLTSKMALAVMLALGGNAAMAGAGGTPQASINLVNEDAKYCYVQDNTWTLTKEADMDAVTDLGTVTWTITATKEPASKPIFCVRGALTVTNSGSAPATIGNIVVNLQKPNSPKKGSKAPYVSIAADVADATNGDDATSANLVAAGSQENQATNSAWGTYNYTVSGSRGTFTETEGSGKLEFKDANSNTLWAITPQQSIPAGGTVTLLYDAEFDSDILPAPGTAMRVEALVTFGNAGSRGGSGASAARIDIDGSGFISGDEANVRTVPTRPVLAALPAAPEETNDSVTVDDLGLTTTGTASFSNWSLVSGPAFPATISEDTVWVVSADVAAGADGGRVCNTASLLGTANGGNLVVGSQSVYDELTGTYIQVPILSPYECAAAASAEATDCVEVSPGEGDDGDDGDKPKYCTYTQGKFNANANNAVANFVQDNFGQLNYPVPGATGRLVIGIDDGIGPRHHAAWTVVDDDDALTGAGAGAFRTWIGGGGKSEALTADTEDATSTSGGTLAIQTGALTMNLALSGSANGQPAGLGDLHYCSQTPGDSLHNKTISEILAAANTALGGGNLPTGYNFSSLNTLLDNINKNGFDDCIAGSFAPQLQPSCP